MATLFNRLGWIVVVVVLVSAFWIFYFGITGGGPSREVTTSGDKVTVDPKGAPAVTVAEGVTVGPAGLAIPVTSIRPAALVDTFTQARAGGARIHDAIDIMAAEGTPVIAAAPGTVEKLFFSNGGGGTSVYVRSADGRWTYYYAHLSAYAPGLHEGQQVLRGAPVGYVGHTGNASPDGPHLHFAINRMNPGEKWYQGAPINPYPLLAGKPVSR
ncbi:MAG: M23 family metallopeptidase [Sphingomonas sp.]|uniref:M23 family metallopeptidase n=1 Tax=Sphingomonas sp. TaxID=28214 RepID=UPI00183CD286|nr:M23 family metallopeptidase [Sphingomonas sp.]MBA3667846.1 M23 family metallopeptidase [Sphingomonas sp.]